MRFFFLFLVSWAPLVSAELSWSPISQEAVSTLGELCADGNERALAYIPETDEVIDLTLHSTKNTVVTEEEITWAQCTHPEVHTYHCHTHSDHVLSTVPSTRNVDNASDVGFAASWEFQCMSRHGQVPHMRHFIVLTGHNSEVVEYGLSDSVRTKIHTLAQRHSNAPDEMAAKLFSQARPLNLYEVQQVSRALTSEFELVIDRTVERYQSQLRDFAAMHCGSIDVREIADCEAFTPKALMDYQCGDEDFVITAYDRGLPLIRVASDCGTPAPTPRAVDVGSTGFSVLSPSSYKTFIKNPQAMMLSCYSTLAPTEQDCNALMEYASAIKSRCKNLQVGVLNAEEYPDVHSDYQFGDEKEPPPIQIFEDGKRLKIVDGTTRPATVAAILCWGEWIRIPGQ